jgi:hypothetical protein
VAIWAKNEPTRVPERLRSPSGCPQLTQSGPVPSFRAASVGRFHPFTQLPGHNLLIPTL